MTAKKILCAIIAGIMVFGVMSFAAFAAETPAEEPGTTEPTAEETPGAETPVTEADITDTITVIFKDPTDPAVPNVYEIALVASTDKIINRLNSLDFTFVNASATIAYEIEAKTDKGITMNAVSDVPHRYEFHFNGKDGIAADNDTGTEIVIGTVTFNGYGTLNFKVDDTATDTNAVHATKADDSIVKSFTAGNGLVIDYKNTDDGTDDSFITGELIAPTHELTIVITFNNNINANAADYQNMTVTVSGGDITVDTADDHVFHLGNQTEVSTDGVVWDETTQTYTIKDTLTENVLYSVKIDGAGYRTTHHTVMMTEPKTLNFWNNVKDPKNAAVIEEGKAEVTKNFLAGDIVDDKIINIYDLSAVVSYFGSEANVENNYAKYDLNRDGVIDSKDVAYVLVSWNE